MTVNIGHSAATSFSEGRARRARTRRAGAVLAVALVGGATGSGSSITAATATTSPPDASEASDAGSDLQALIDGCKEEGNVRWYTEDITIMQPTVDAFKEAYDIDIEATRKIGAEIYAQFLAEYDSGVHIPDVYTAAHTVETMRSLLEGGYTRPLAEAGIPAYEVFPDDLKIESAGAAVINLRPWSIGYNTDLVDADEVPTTWEDLLDPKWNGLINTVDPLVTTTYTDYWDAMVNELGEDFLSGMATQSLNIRPGLLPSNESMAAGEAAITFPNTPGALLPLQDSGAPVDWVTPEFTSYYQNLLVLPSEPEHPNCARLLANFMLAEDSSNEIFTFPGSFGAFGRESPDYPSQAVGPREGASEGANIDRIVGLLGLG